MQAGKKSLNNKQLKKKVSVCTFFRFIPFSFFHVFFLNIAEKKCSQGGVFFACFVCRCRRKGTIGLWWIRLCATGQEPGGGSTALLQIANFASFFSLFLY